MEPVILLVEDTPSDVLMMKRLFLKVGLRRPLQVVRDGVDATSYLLGRGEYSNREQYPLPSILLIDLNLPRLNGLELLTWLRTQPDFQHLMLIVLTGSARVEEINCAYEKGANSYLVKPTQPDELEKLVKAFYQYWIVQNHLPDATPRSDARRRFSEQPSEKRRSDSGRTKTPARA